MAPNLCFNINIGLAWVVVASMVIRSVVGEVVPFLDPGFFFSYSKLPVTQQCETITLSWGRAAASTGPNPVAPYFFQIFTSSFIVPFIIEAGDGADAGNNMLSFDFTVPFAPGTQYQICMYDSLGTAGGCQMLYTMIANTTVANPTCQNVTFPAESTVLDITPTADGGQVSQNGFVNQCDEVSLKPGNGTPPFILTVSPANHPPYNITSYTMDPIVWTVSLSRAFNFFLSVVSSEGMVWTFGPMGVGASDVDVCLAPDAILKTKAHAVAAGAGIGGLFGGLFLVGAVYLVNRYWFCQKKHLVTPWSDGTKWGSESSSDENSRGSSLRDSSGRNEKPRLDPLVTANEGVRGVTLEYGYNASPNANNLQQPTPVSTIYPGHSPSQLFVRHQDGGRLIRATNSRMFSSPLEVTQEVVELPPDYVGRMSEEGDREGEEEAVVEGSSRNSERRHRALPERPDMFIPDLKRPIEDV